MRGVVALHAQPVGVAPWPLLAAQALEEHHLCAWSPRDRQRERFVADLASMLSRIDQTQVAVINGADAVNLDSFAAALGRALGVPRIAPSIDGDSGIVDALRAPHIGPDGRPVRRRYIIWSDAHEMLAADARLFGRLVDALMGVAAEGELVSEDVLLLQRVVFVGRPSLDVYAEDPRGQFRRWYSESGEPGLWRVVTGLKAPSVVTWRIGDEVGV